MLPDEPAPIPYEPLPLPDARSARTSHRARADRLRRRAAIVLVGTLAMAWFLTTQLGRKHAPPAPTLAAPTHATAPGPRHDAALLRVLPAGAQCDDQDGSGSEVRCAVAGVDVEYRTLPLETLRRAFRTAVGAAPYAVSGVRPPACARGAEEERPWSRPAAPRVVAGRYACRVEQGRAAMWWTVDDRGLLVHAIVTDGDLSSLYVWWESHVER